eukprot:1795151-Pyramimonas_sp.AAC.1
MTTVVGNSSSCTSTTTVHTLRTDATTGDGMISQSTAITITAILIPATTTTAIAMSCYTTITTTITTTSVTATILLEP